MLYLSGVNKTAHVEKHADVPSSLTHPEHVIIEASLCVSAERIQSMEPSLIKYQQTPMLHHAILTKPTAAQNKHDCMS